MPFFADHRMLGRAQALLFVAVSSLTLLGALSRATNNDLWIASQMGLLLLAACAGWGSSLARMIAPARTVDLGLRMVWGMSLLLFFGGVIALLHAFSNGAVFVLIELGLLQAAAAAWKEQRSLGRWLRIFVGRMTLARAVCGALLCAVAAWAYLGAAADDYLNPYDDHPAYLPLIKRLLVTGTLFEPFSERRALSLGGQTVLQSFIYARSSFDQIQLFDSGVCKVLLLFLIWGDSYRSEKSAWHAQFVASLLVLGLPQQNINSASYFSGACFFLGLARTIAWLRPLANVRTHLPVALVAAATLTLRNSYVPVLFFMLAFYAWREFRSVRHRFRVAVGVAVAFVALLLPWLWLSIESTGSPLYPAILGNGNPDALMLGAPRDFLDFGSRIVTAVSVMMPLSTLPLFLLAALLIRETNWHRPILGLLLGATGGFLVLLWQAPTLDSHGIARYTFPSFAALAIFALLRGSKRKRGDALRTSYVLGVLATALATFMNRDATAYLYSTFGASIRERMHAHGSRPMTLDGERELRAQSFAERGKTIGVMLDQPFALDFGRNPILNFDLPGTLSPKPGMPRFRGPEAVRTYLRNLHVRYVLFVRPDASKWLFRDALWLSHGIATEALQANAAYMHEFTRVLSGLATKDAIRFEEEGIVLIDLESSP